MCATKCITFGNHFSCKLTACNDFFFFQEMLFHVEKLTDYCLDEKAARKREQLLSKQIIMLGIALWQSISAC